MANDIVRDNGKIIYVDPNEVFGYGGENGITDVIFCLS